MVILSKADNDKIAAAVTEAEAMTSAEIAVVITPNSSAYAEYVLGIGLLAGLGIVINLYAAHILMHFPELLLVQVITMVLLFFTPWLRHICWRFVPRGVKRRRSYRRAMEEFNLIHNRHPHAVPLVVLYVSLAERYSHIITSQIVHEKIDNDNWERIIGRMKETVVSQGLANACCVAAREAGTLLSGDFPENGDLNRLSNHAVISES